VLVRAIHRCDQIDLEELNGLEDVRRVCHHAGGMPDETARLEGHIEGVE
jgi:hypothetical protein